MQTTPKTAQAERRTHRSDDVMTALHYQLAFARHEGGIEALVLTDATGCLVAGAGAWPTCEMLAAYAPLLATPHAKVDEDLVDRASVEIRKLMIDGSEVLLCARGGGAARTSSMARAASGCRRILGGEA